MGTIFVLVCGIIGSGHAYKKDFASSWGFLISLAFALYAGIFLAPVVIPQLPDFPWLEPDHKKILVFAGLVVIIVFVLQIIAQQILQFEKNDFDLPPISRLLSLCTGFLSGSMVAGILLHCFTLTSFAGRIPQTEGLRSAADNTLNAVVRTVNFLSFQSQLPQIKEEEKESPKSSSQEETTVPNCADQPKSKEMEDQKSPDKTAKNESSVAPRTEDQKKKVEPVVQNSRKYRSAGQPMKKEPDEAPADDAAPSKRTKKHWRRPPAHPWPLSR